MKTAFWKKKTKQTGREEHLKRTFSRETGSGKGPVAIAATVEGTKWVWSPVGDEEMRRHPDSQAGRLSSAPLCRSPELPTSALAEGRML